jgi:hypothetical protein
MTTSRGPFVQLHLYARRTIMPTTLHDDSTTQKRDRRPTHTGSRAGSPGMMRRRHSVNTRKEAIELASAHLRDEGSAFGCPSERAAP